MMTNEEAISYLEMAVPVKALTKEEFHRFIEALNMAFKALEQEPCEDYISRQALLKLIGEEPFNWTDSDKELQAVEDYRNFRNIVEQLPSVNSQEPCEDAVSRQVVKEQMIKYGFLAPDMTVAEFVEDCLSPVNSQKLGHCKDCKYFEYDSVAKVGGIPLIVAHEICNKWGDGCKTSEEGFCFLFEPQESEVAE